MDISVPSPTVTPPVNSADNPLAGGDSSPPIIDQFLTVLKHVPALVQLQTDGDDIHKIRQCLLLTENAYCPHEIVRAFSIDDQDLLWSACEDCTLKLLIVLPKSVHKDTRSLERY